MSHVLREHNGIYYGGYKLSGWGVGMVAGEEDTTGGGGVRGSMPDPADWQTGWSKMSDTPRWDTDWLTDVEIDYVIDRRDA